MTVDKTLLILGCLILVSLGGVHAVWTLFTDKFESRDSGLMAAMKTTSPKLTSRTSMWKAWVGFNISHSIGAIVFGLFYIIVALENYPYLRSSIALNALLLMVPTIYLALAVRYWFDVPRNGIITALALLITSLIARTHPWVVGHVDNCLGSLYSLIR